MRCATCEHCNDDERDPRDGTAGICTHADAYFAHELVPEWLSGCRHYSEDWDKFNAVTGLVIASPQGDGDPGSEAA